MNMVSLAVGSPLVVMTPEGESRDVVVRLIDHEATPVRVQLVQTQRHGECVIYQGRAYVLRPDR